MIRHLVRLAWRRRRSNILVAAEIAASFVVVSLVFGFAAQFALNGRRPTGFEWRDRWAVQVDPGAARERAWSAEDAATLRQLFAAARSLPYVVGIAGSTGAPYDTNEENSHYVVEGRLVDAEVNMVTREYREVMGVDVVAGRWFEEGDELAGWRPIVVDRDFERLFCPGQSAVGKSLPRDEGEVERRVVGVVSEFREAGELAGPRPYLFGYKAADATEGRRIEVLTLHLAPGTTLDVEPELLATLRAAAPGWDFEAKPLAKLRERSFRSVLVPLAAGGVVAAFLLAMVALGLLGVLWQNVMRRTHEFALRRAVGATTSDVRLLVLGELAMVALLAILVGAVVIVQVPLLQLVPGVRLSSQLVGLAAAGIFVLGLVIACGLYPSRLAMRAEPAEALRSE